MANTLITTPDDIDGVRKAIDIRLTIATLPDAVISLPIYVGAAERWVRQRDPNLASRVDDELDAAKLAATYYAAALLIDALPQMLSETTISYRYQMAEFNVDARRARLLSMADAALDYLDPGNADTIAGFFGFDVACGDRGR